MSTASSTPISLFLDESPIRIAGESALLHWWVRNDGNQPIHQFKLELMNMDAHATSQHQDDVTLYPGDEKRRVSSTLKIRESGHYALPLHITARFEDGKPLELTSAYEPIFSYESAQKDGDTTVIVKGNALFKGVRSSGRLHIEVGGDAVFKDVDFGTGRQAQHSTHGHTAPEESALTQVKLRILEPQGVRPVNLEKLLAYWPHSTHLNIKFTGEQGQTLSHARVDDLYRLKIRTFGDGYLTLISRGTSGKFYVMAPNTVGLGMERLAKGHHDFPGKQLLPLDNMAVDEQEIFFADPGTEFMLALLSKGPLMQAAMPPFSHIPEALLADLLIYARSQPDTDIGLAKIEVKE